MSRIFTINSRRFDQSIRRSWECEIVAERELRLMFVGVFDREIVHTHLGRIAAGTISYEYYWLNRWYNVFRFHEPDGTFRNFYCNINMPPKIGDNVLDYVDLDIDVIVDGSGRLAVLDEDEFDANAAAFGYPAEIHRMAASAVDELKDLIEGREFPFDYLKSVQQNDRSFVLESSDLNNQVEEKLL